MGRMKDLATGIEFDTDALEQSGLSPVQYIVVDDEPLDIDEVNFQLQLTADEAKE